MEINKYPQGSQPIGVLVTEDIVEGSFVVLTSHSWNSDFGSLTDLSGVKYPTSATEAAQAKYCITFTPPDRNVGANAPIYIPQPAYNFALREGYDQTANLPMTSTTVRISWPGNQEGVTIPSGWKALVFTTGAEVTIPSGQYVYSSNLEVPGALLEVLNSGDDGSDKGKLSYSASGTIAEVIRLRSTDSALEVRIIA